MVDTLNVLVVDDEEAMCRGAERALKRFRLSLPEMDSDVQFSVRSALDAAQAEKAMGEQMPDLLLLDHKLPDKTGLEILDELENQDGNVLTIVVTAYASLETAVQATKRGAYDFLAKPFPPEELRGAVQKAAKHLVLQRQARRLADEKRQVRFQFTSMLAHEMKSPIAAVEGYLHVIQQRARGDSVEQYDSMLNRSLDRIQSMKDMINDLLDLTAIESGQKKRDIEDVDIVDMAQKALDTFRPQAEEQGMTVEAQLPEKLPMQADASEIDMILNNLMSNGLKYNRENGCVTLRCSDEGERIKISVTDTGIGISEEDQEKLFQDFARIKNDRTRGISGTGLGLSTVKKLAALYDGDVHVTSVPDEGSTFTVELRRSDAEEEQRI